MMIALAWRNIWRNKRRSIITLSSIGFSVVFATMLNSLQHGTFEKLIDNSVKFYLGHFQIQNPEYWEDKTLDNCMVYSDSLDARIASTEGVIAYSPRIESFALASSGEITRASMLLGINPDHEDKIIGLSNKLVEGQLIAHDGNGVLLGAGLADYLKLGIADTLILISQGYHGANAAGLFVVQGILKFPNPLQDKQLVVMPLKKAQWFYDMDSRVTSVAVLLNDYKIMPGVESDLAGGMDKKSERLVDWQTMSPDLIQLAELKYASTDIMTLILYLVIGFGMFGTFLMMTMERIREFGMMLAVGMKRFLLQKITFIEIFMLSALGVLAGLALSLLILLYLHYFPIELGSSYNEIAEAYGIQMMIDFSLKPTIFYSQALAVIIIALILSFYPLLKIHKIEPVEALREG